jgi:hypothetical protein
METMTMTDRPRSDLTPERNPYFRAYERDPVGFALAVERQARGERERMIAAALRNAWRRLTGKPAASPAYAQPVLVRYEEVEDLLARNDNELAAQGLSRDELEAFRDGRLLFVHRRSA